MSDPEGIKAWLNNYLSAQKRVVPEYTFTTKPAGRGRTRFICEVNVPTFEYVGIGNSTSKKDAQTNAARDFASFLVREGIVPASNVPVLKPGETGEFGTQEIKAPEATPNNYQLPTPPSAPVLPYNDSYIGRIFDQKKLEEAEEVDLTADIHGGWSMENAKSQLNEYLQATRQPMSQVKFTVMGADHNRSFVAELTVYAKALRKTLYARESGSNKQTASRACCLSLVRQLFHAGEIEAYTGEKKKKKRDEVPPLDVQLNTNLEKSLSELLDDLKLSPAMQPTNKSSDGEPCNMITNYNVVDFQEKTRQQAQKIPWCPPLPNWNPWLSCNMDEGIDASMSLNEISTRLRDEYFGRLNQDNQLQDKLKAREELPTHVYKDRILNTINNSRVTLIRGETGCGKTTQIPQFILDSYIESGRGANCSVLVTQPRRISAISLAERIAHERCETIGTSVGYCVRFETIFPRPYGSILFCTVGTMARKMESGLRGVSHIVIDEIHERDVNSDFMIIVLRTMLQSHRDLRIVLMSATIDTTMFTEYFGDCTVLDIEGRTHPVQHYFLEDCIQMLNYVPSPNDERRRKRRQESAPVSDENEDNCNRTCDPEYGEVVLRSLREIAEKEVPFDLIVALLEHISGMQIPGAILIFLPGWNIISLLRKFIQSHPRFGSTDYLILPLHSQVPREDQRLVFRESPPGVTKIVLSTNIAETSITINDVVFVIDFCLVRMKLFTARNNLTSYSTSWASKTNLEQRRGRAGRVRAGYAFHMCSRTRFARLDQHTAPEILRTPLHELALLIKLLKLGAVGDFLKQALQPPPLDAVIEAEYTLKEMKALDRNDELTPLGSILARLPMEPRLGKMMVFACLFGLGGTTAVLAVSSSLGCDPFLLPPDRRRLSNTQLRFTAGYCSDHLTSLNVFQVWSSERARSGDSAADILCERRQLNGPTLRVMEDAANQIRRILINLSFPEQVLSDAAIDFHKYANEDCDALASLLIIGLYPNISFHVDKRKMLTVEGTVALTHKSSVNCSNEARKFPFPYFVFDEKIRTQAVSCKGLTMVNPIQVMLFGCRTAIWKTDPPGDPNNGLVLLDDWIPLRMPFVSAALIFALRPALEALLVRACLRPEHLSEMDESDRRVIQITKDLCSQAALSANSSNFSQKSTTSESGEPPYKRASVDLNHPLLSGHPRRIDEMEDRGFERYVNHPERSRFVGGAEMERNNFGMNPPAQPWVDNCATPNNMSRPPFGFPRQPIPAYPASNFAGPRAPYRPRGPFNGDRGYNRGYQPRFRPNRPSYFDGPMPYSGNQPY